MDELDQHPLFKSLFVAIQVSLACSNLKILLKQIVGWLTHPVKVKSNYTIWALNLY